MDSDSSSIEGAEKELARYVKHPALFVSEQFGVTPDAWQLAALDAFADPSKPRISLQACAGPGKSALLAWCGWHFLSCQGDLGQHPKGAVVSITWDNLRDNLWSEMAKWQARSKFLMSAFTWSKERIFAKDHPETWFLAARSWSKTADQEQQGRTLSGLHSEYVLALIDESGDIPTTVLRAAEQALSNCKWGKIVIAGNPSSRDGMLYAAATSLRAQWHIISITGDPDDDKRSPRIDATWARRQIETYGRENPWVMSYILGLFPPNSINSLLGPDDVRAAVNRGLGQDAYTWSQKRIGVDVARFGDDATVIFGRQGLNANMQPVVMRSARTDEIASRVSLAKAKYHSDCEYVDDTGGFGSGVIDCLRQAGHRPIAVNFSGKPDEIKYYNKRAEMWFRLSDWIKAGGSIPACPELEQELTAPTYTFLKGRFLIEEKEQIKKRLGRSTDYSDALALTFAHVDMPAAHRSDLDLPMFRNLVGTQKARIESDIYAEENYA